MGNSILFLRNSMKYVALLRGINVGGKKKVSMEKLREMLTGIGFENVQTLLASGNVIFEGDEHNAEQLAKKIEESFAKTFGFTSKIILRTMDEITALIKLNPFKEIHITPTLRLYVTFFADKPISTLKLPYKSANSQILVRTEREVIMKLAQET